MKRFLYFVMACALIAFTCDINVSASLYKMADNHITIRIPRADWTPEPWFEWSSTANDVMEHLPKE